MLRTPWAFDWHETHVCLAERERDIKTRRIWRCSSHGLEKRLMLPSQFLGSRCRPSSDAGRSRLWTPNLPLLVVILSGDMRRAINNMKDQLAPEGKLINVAQSRPEVYKHLFRT